MDFLGILYSIVALIVTIGVLVTVHEYGHFWVARRLGIRVLRFSIGFGRPLWRRRFGADNTEFVIAALPLGGYVFRVSRPGHFKGIRMCDAYPLPVLPDPMDREARGSPIRNHLKRRKPPASYLRKDIITHLGN